MKIENVILFLVCILILIGCKRTSIDGIIIGNTLLAHQSLEDNRILERFILNTLEGDEKALAALKDFPCGGGAGCYDLGYIITQIIYQIGEDEFVKMLQATDARKGIESLIKVGLEYGDNDYDGKMDNKSLKQEFPKVLHLLSD